MDSPGPKGRLLVIEEDGSDRDAMMTSLEGAHFVCGAAPNRAAALEVLFTSIPDVVLLDLDLPNREGLELLTAFRQWDDRQFAVIAYSADRALQPIATKSGGFGFLVKPLDPAKLIRQVEIQLDFQKTREHLRGLTEG